MLNFFKKSLLERYLDLYADYQKYATQPNQLKNKVNHFLNHLSAVKLHELVGYLRIDFKRLYNKFHDLHLDSVDKEQVSRDLSAKDANATIHDLTSIKVTKKNLEIDLAFYKPFADGLVIFHDLLSSKIQYELQKVSEVRVAAKR